MSFILHAGNPAGQFVTVTLGRYPDLPLKAAREMAVRQRQALKSGVDPNAEKRARRERADAAETSPVLRAIVGEYQALHAARRASWWSTS